MEREKRECWTYLGTADRGPRLGPIESWAWIVREPRTWNPGKPWTLHVGNPWTRLSAFNVAFPTKREAVARIDAGKARKAAQRHGLLTDRVTS